MVSSFRDTQTSRRLKQLSVAVTQFLRHFQKRGFHGSQPRCLREVQVWSHLASVEGFAPGRAERCLGGNEGSTTRGRSPSPLSLRDPPVFLLLGRVKASASVLVHLMKQMQATATGEFPSVTEEGRSHHLPEPGQTGSIGFPHSSGPGQKNPPA